MCDRLDVVLFILTLWYSHNSYIISAQTLLKHFERIITSHIMHMPTLVQMNGRSYNHIKRLQLKYSDMHQPERST